MRCFFNCSIENIKDSKVKYMVKKIKNIDFNVEQILNSFLDNEQRNIDVDIIDINKNLYNKRIDILKIERRNYLNITLLNNFNLNTLIYDENWPSYLDCILKLRQRVGDPNEDIQKIVEWLMIFK